jgi:hypothetical protein
MIVAVNPSALKQSKWYELALRFVLGGLVTAAAAEIADKIGPSFGGLFLAFPAILCASVTLVEKHERQRKEKKALHGTYRGREAASADAAGAAMGSVGLFGFAWFSWKLLPDHNAAAVIVGATLLWAMIAGTVWLIWKKKLLRRLWNGASRRVRGQ